ncbi:hypothetical protein [Litorimonas sp. WD9-15]|uniref:hypothetical protein n=1 Tax=Litorimonas sp. WD9-15 TaxID=3418716 RepID=UPI003CFD5456
MSDISVAMEPKRPVVKRSADDRMLGVMAAFAVTWGLLCLIMFALSLMADPETMAKQYTAEQLAYVIATPAWVMFAKAMTAIGVLCGAVYLLLRKQSAYTWFMIALFGTLLTMLDSILRHGYETMGGMMSGVNIGMVIVCIFLFWASHSAFQEGQLSPE